MSHTEINANDFLMGSGVKSAEFPDRAYGTTWTGTICEPPRVTQQTDLKTKELKFWKSDGKPMMMLVVVIQTEVRDPNIPDDDGKRSFYVKAKLQAAIRDAVRQAGARGLEIGGTLSVTYTGDGNPDLGMSPPKFYSATYTSPAFAAANQFIQGGAPAPQYAPPAPPAAQPVYAAPAPAYVPPAPVAQVAAGFNVADKEQAFGAPAQAAPVAAFTPPDGMDPAVAAALANMTPAQRAQLGLPA